MIILHIQIAQSDFEQKSYFYPAGILHDCAWSVKTHSVLFLGHYRALHGVPFCTFRGVNLEHVYEYP